MSTLPYVDGFVIPVPKDKLEAYKTAATQASVIWKEHGALEYFECAADDLEARDMRSFSDLAAAGPDETVVFAFVIYPSREARDAANAAIMEDPRIKDLCTATDGIFDCRRMAFGGFQTIVKA